MDDRFDALGLLERLSVRQHMVGLLAATEIWYAIARVHVIQAYHARVGVLLAFGAVLVILCAGVLSIEDLTALCWVDHAYLLRSICMQCLGINLLLWSVCLYGKPDMAYDTNARSARTRSMIVKAAYIPRETPKARCTPAPYLQHYRGVYL